MVIIWVTHERTLHNQSPTSTSISISITLYWPLHYHMLQHNTTQHLTTHSVENLSGPVSPSGIKPEDLTDDVFSYIFLAKELPLGTSTAIPDTLLKSMREVWFIFFENSFLLYTLTHRTHVNSEEWKVFQMNFWISHITSKHQTNEFRGINEWRPLKIIFFLPMQKSSIYMNINLLHKISSVHILLYPSSNHFLHFNYFLLFLRIPGIRILVSIWSSRVCQRSHP